MTKLKFILYWTEIVTGSNWFEQIIDHQSKDISDR